MDGNDQPYGKMFFSSKNALENINNPEWEWTELTKLLPSTPAFDLLTPHSYFISPLSTCHTLHCTLFPVGTPIPPHPNTLHHCFRGFTENNTHRRDGYSLKSNDFFGGRDSTPPCSNAISPSGSVMII